MFSLALYTCAALVIAVCLAAAWFLKESKGRNSSTSKAQAKLKEDANSLKEASVSTLSSGAVFTKRTGSGLSASEVSCKEVDEDDVDEGDEDEDSDGKEDGEEEEGEEDFGDVEPRGPAAYPVSDPAMSTVDPMEISLGAPSSYVVKNTFLEFEGDSQKDIQQKLGQSCPADFRGFFAGKPNVSLDPESPNHSFQQSPKSPHSDNASFGLHSSGSFGDNKFGQSGFLGTGSLTGLGDMAAMAKFLSNNEVSRAMMEQMGHIDSRSSDGAKEPHGGLDSSLKAGNVSGVSVAATEFDWPESSVPQPAPPPAVGPPPAQQWSPSRAADFPIGCEFGSAGLMGQQSAASAGTPLQQPPPPHIPSPPHVQPQMPMQAHMAPPALPPQQLQPQHMGSPMQIASQPQLQQQPQTHLQMQQQQLPPRPQTAAPPVAPPTWSPRLEPSPPPAPVLSKSSSQQPVVCVPPGQPVSPPNLAVGMNQPTHPGYGNPVGWQQPRPGVVPPPSVPPKVGLQPQAAPPKGLPVPPAAPPQSHAPQFPAAQAHAQQPPMQHHGQQPAATDASSPIAVYRVIFQGGIHLCRGPSMELGRTGHTLKCGDNFTVAEILDGHDSRKWLRLADGRGWAFDDTAVFPKEPSVDRLWVAGQTPLAPGDEDQPIDPASLTPRTRLRLQKKGLLPAAPKVKRPRRSAAARRKKEAAAAAAASGLGAPEESHMSSSTPAGELDAGLRMRKA